VGKTQLVFELHYRIKDKHKQRSIIWIPAIYMGSLHRANLAVTRELRTSSWEEEKADAKKPTEGYLSKDAAPLNRIGSLMMFPVLVLVH
jgi:hypothetical protein